MKISVCVITYNQDKFISQMLESVLAQKLNFSYEIVIGEDCSTDKTREILLDYQKKYPKKIKLLLNDKNLGVVENFIQTLRHCTGEYIATCEADDYWTDPHKLQRQVDFLDTHSDYVVCYQEAKVINEKGSIINHNYGYRKDFSSEELIKGPIIPLHSLCFRNVLRDFPIEAKKMAGCHKFLISLLGLYGKGKWLGDSISPGRYRIHSGGSWSTKDKKEKLFIDANTCFWTYQYYKRIGKEKYADYWKNEFLRVVSKINTSDNILSFQITQCFIRLGFLNKLLQIKFKKE
ncbi:MAG: glycosyltransferase [Candidatus Pacebacteria bacterium]|nr:glycosyltransferase [Candidatus Paceibacterota bacterium]